MGLGARGSCPRPYKKRRQRAPEPNRPVPEVPETPFHLRGRENPVSRFHGEESVFPRRRSVGQLVPRTEKPPQRCPRTALDGGLPQHIPVPHLCLRLGNLPREGTTNLPTPFSSRPVGAGRTTASLSSGPASPASAEFCFVSFCFGFCFLPESPGTEIRREAVKLGRGRLCSTQAKQN